MNKTALVIGVTGQDGSYLAHHLLSRDYRVVGSSRDANSANLHGLRSLRIDQDLEIISIAPADFRSVLSAIKYIKPDEIYNLSGQTSVGRSFEQPVESMESIYNSTLNLLEALRYFDNGIKLFNAGSSEAFGNTKKIKASEQSCLSPCSPYAVAKAASMWLVANYRDAYGVYACTGILANHESPLRPGHFVTKKIVKAVQDTVKDKSTKLRLGNIQISRDWGWAPEYTQAMHLMLQNTHPKDYVVATGETHSLEDFLSAAYRYFDLDYKQHILQDETLVRPSDIPYSSLCPDAIFHDLGWSASTKFERLVNNMVNDILF